MQHRRARGDIAGERRYGILRDARQVNHRHYVALRCFGRESATQGLLLGGAELTLLQADEEQLEALITETPASLFSVASNIQTTQPSCEQWWCIDVLVDHLLMAREMATWSVMAAQIMTGVDEDVIVAMDRCGITELRRIAENCSVAVKWPAKELRRTMGMIAHERVLEEDRIPNASLMIACNVARMASRPKASGVVRRLS